MEEAKNFGHVHVACSSKADKYRHIPTQYQVSDFSKYLHITSNNTVYGT
jgi:phosphoserine aminotransferase